MNAMSVTSLENLKLKNYNVIGVDEGHFFPQLYTFCTEYKHCTIYVAALNGTFERKPFESIQKLIPISDDILFLHGVCVICNSTKASCTVKTVAEIKTDQDGICVGGDDMYTITCSKCYEKDITMDIINERKRVIEDTKKLIK
jgi:thymidine kinase